MGKPSAEAEPETRTFEQQCAQCRIAAIERRRSIAVVVLARYDGVSGGRKFGLGMGFDKLLKMQFVSLNPRRGARSWRSFGGDSR